MDPKNPAAESSSDRICLQPHARTLLADPKTIDVKISKLLAPGLSAEFRIGFDAYSETNGMSQFKQLIGYESNIAHLDNSGIPTDTVNTQYGKEEKTVRILTVGRQSEQTFQRLNLSLNY
ncbi:MAG: hypothetical protein ACLR6J_11545 [Parabacteroides merdae]